MVVFSLFYDVTLQIGSNGKMKAYLRPDKITCRGVAISCVISINVLWYCVTLWSVVGLICTGRVVQEEGRRKWRGKRQDGGRGLEAASMALFPGLCSVSHLQFHGVSDEHNGSPDSETKT